MQDLTPFFNLILKEDIGSKDLTTISFIPKNLNASAEIIFKEDGIVSGLDFIKKLIDFFDKSLKLKTNFQDGSLVKKNEILAIITGNAHSILKIERTMLNFLQRLSGIATLAKQFSQTVLDLNVKILDTRKTSPAIRFLEKKAVLDGGCSNHRLGLYDMILLKENHICLIDNLEYAITQFKQKNKTKKIEIEVDSITLLKKVLSMPVDIIMLDNFSLTKTKKAVSIIKNHKKNILIESSGNINLKNVRKYALLGVDRISVGSLTHSAKALDISLKIKK